MNDYTLYGFNGSTYVRSVRMLFAEKAVDYRQVPVNILTGEGRSPEHLQRHPFGKVPVLQWGGMRLFETGAIMELIEGLHPLPAFTPAEPYARAIMRQWMSVIDNYGYPTLIGRLVWQRVVNPMLGAPTQDGEVQEALPAVRHQFRQFDQALVEKDYLAGEQPSLADLLLAPIMDYVSMTPEAADLFTDYPNVNAWWQRVRQRESFARTPPFD